MYVDFMETPLKTTCCRVRKEEVALQPEEQVRQQLLTKMMETLGYPPAHLTVEKALNQLPHLAHANRKLPDRRADILCFAAGIHPDYGLYPLLLIECKAHVALNTKVVRQATSYNQFVGAYFIALANESGAKTGWYDPQQGRYRFISGIPPYSVLIEACTRMRDGVKYV